MNGRRIHRIAFQPRFHAAILSGTKRTTIRPPRKRAIRVGDLIQPYGWEGKPYRSKTFLVGKPRKVVGVGPVRLSDHGEVLFYVIEGIRLGARSIWECEGFASQADMLAWFRDGPGLPFNGVMIAWGGEA